MSAWDNALTYSAAKNGWAVDCYLGGAEPLRTETEMDTALNGGLMPGLTLLGGVASAGKSAIACQIAANLASNGKKVLYFTLDDSWGNIISRCMSSWSVRHNFEDHGPLSWSDLPRLRKQLHIPDGENLSRFAFEQRKRDNALFYSSYWDDGPARNLAAIDSIVNIGDIEKMFSSLVSDGDKPDLVVIDYVQQYQTGDADKDNNEYGRVSEVADRLQHMGLSYDIPILVISSLRKLGKNDTEPTLDWYRGTSALGYSSWAACVLTKGERKDDGWQETKINVVKNKSGKTGFSVSVKLWGAFSWSEPLKEL